MTVGLPSPTRTEEAVPFQRCVERPFGAALRPGFTLIEVVIVLLILGVLGAIAVPGFRKYTDQRAVNNARDAFIRTAAQARAESIRTGDRVEMHIDPAADMVVVIGAESDTLATLDLRNGPIRANLTGTAFDGPNVSSGSVSTPQFRVCYVPRGYALPACGTGNDLPRLVHFASLSGGHTGWARVTVGQAERR
jgi:prepilin-type N-terminal cleavage/methylation domain-containing protein